jgi:hypothetical protein
MLLGLVDGFETEFGYFSLDELESLDVYGFGVVPEPRWIPKPISEIKSALKQGKGTRAGTSDSMNRDYPETCEALKMSHNALV